MDKPSPTDFSALDLKLIEDSITNIDNMVTSNRSTVPVSQKQLVNSLEYLISSSKMQNTDELTHVYRLLLKVHHKMTNINSDLAIQKQVQVMTKFLNYEVSKLETKLLADQTY
jgi:hypothetical protein